MLIESIERRLRVEADYRANCQCKVDDLAGRILDRYDEDKDGLVDAGERVAVRHCVRYDAVESVPSPRSRWYHPIRVQVPYAVEEQVGLEALFSAADTDGDGRVGEGDLRRILASFDSDQDGLLSGADLGLLSSAFPETRSLQERPACYHWDASGMAVDEARTPGPRWGDVYYQLLDPEDLSSWHHAALRPRP